MTVDGLSPYGGGGGAVSVQYVPPSWTDVPRTGLNSSIYLASVYMFYSKKDQSLIILIILSCRSNDLKKIGVSGFMRAYSWDFAAIRRTSLRRCPPFRPLFPA